MALFDSVPSSAATIPANPPKATGSLFGGVTSAPKPGAAEGTMKLGSALIAGIGGEVSKLFSDIHKTAFTPVRSWNDFWNVALQTGEEVTRPIRALALAIPQAAVSAVSMPIQSAIQAATGKSESYTLPILGKFESYQDMRKQLAPQFGDSVAAVFPIVQEALNLMAVAPGEGSIGRLFGKIAPEATQAAGAVQYFGKFAKGMSEEDLGTFNNMTKLQAATEALKTEAPDSINIQKMMASGMSAEDAQASALKTIVERSKKITPSQHLNMIYSIARNMGETPEEVAANLPNYLAKSKLFEQIAPDVAKKVFNPETGQLGVNPEKLVLLRNDTLTDRDVTAMIEKVEKEPFSGNMDGDAAQYASMVDRLYKEYPALKFYHNHLEPVMTAGGKDLEAYTVEGFRGKYDLINRLNQIKQVVNKEVDVQDPALAETLAKIGSEEGGTRGYKIGFSPLEYTPMIPKNYVPIPEQNFLGKVVDQLGLREIDRRLIKDTWESKFNSEFDKAFPNGIVDAKGDTWTTGFTDPIYKKSGALKYAGGEGNIIDRLYAIAKANNSISITEISPKDLRTFFGDENGNILRSIIAKSRVLPVGMEGWGVTLVNRMRQSKLFDDFYRLTLMGRFGYSPGFAVRHYFKNQILGAFEGKPINIAGFANTEIGAKLIARFPTIFGGTPPTLAEWQAFNDTLGHIGFSVDPASEVWVFSHMGEDLQNQAVKTALKSGNEFEKIVGYVPAYDSIDLTRSSLKKYGLQLTDLYDRPDIAKDMESLVRTTYNYGPGVISSPAIKTLNTIFYPIRFETKVLLNTAKWWANAPVLTRSLTVKLFNDAIANSNTKEAKDFMKKNALAVRAISYLVPYTTMMNVFQDAINTVGNFNTPSKALGSAWNTVNDSYQLGGLMFGIFIQTAQNQGILPQSQYIDPTGKKYPIWVPKGAMGRLKSLLTTWLTYMWPSGIKTLELTPGGIGTAVQHSLPGDQYLPASQHTKIAPNTVRLKF